MDVSVIIPIYNGAKILPITMPSLNNQDYPSNNFEIIYINDASTDDSMNLLKAYQWDVSVSIIDQQTNKGRAATRNVGIKKASGKLLIFLDCDIEVQFDFISQHVNYHSNHKIMGVVSKICSKDELKNKYAKYIFYGKRGASIIGSNKPIPFNYFIIGCTSIKAEVINKSGLLNENLIYYGEDLDFAYRIWKFFPNGLYFAEEIEVFMHDVKSLEEALKNLYEYGKYNVPIILQEFPEISKHVAVDYIKSIDGKLSLKILIGYLLINKPIFEIIKHFLIIIPYPLSNYIIKYLMGASIGLGYKKHCNN